MARAPVSPDHEDHLCGCDVPFTASEATADDDLPAAVGGIALAGTGDEIDGCDVDFDSADATPDEDLPAATGGVMDHG